LAKYWVGPSSQETLSAVFGVNRCSVLHAIINDESGEIQQAVLRKYHWFLELEEKRKKQLEAEREEFIAWLESLYISNQDFMRQHGLDPGMKALNG
jgi:hypothetical protein